MQTGAKGRDRQHGTAGHVRTGWLAFMEPPREVQTASGLIAIRPRRHPEP